jgi:hypothetical protein
VTGAGAARRCLARLLDAQRLIDAGEHDAAAAILTDVRAELGTAGNELTAPLSLVWMFIERLEERVR